MEEHLDMKKNSNTHCHMCHQGSAVYAGQDRGPVQHTGRRRLAIAYDNLRLLAYITTKHLQD